MKEFLKKELYSFRAVAAILARWLLLAVPMSFWLPVNPVTTTSFSFTLDSVRGWCLTESLVSIP